ncbi:MAG: cytochrome c [Deltaproteobacteria bacterium]|nr:cytochrome c [Deltaproteobacteria bacterium]
MKRTRKFMLCLMIMSFLVSLQVKAAFNASQTFDKKCSSCHSIGGGVVKGPDLKGVSDRRSEEWLVRFIQSADSMIQSGDPEAVKLYNEYDQKDMPDQRLSDSEVKAILEFIAGGGEQVDVGEFKSATKASPEDILKGRSLFLGEVSFAKGGPACLSCHSVGNYGFLGGGTLAKNLTHIYSDYNDKGLSVALSKLAFPVMEEVYADKSLTDDENFQIKAFLYSVDKEGVEPFNFQKKFVFLGVGGVVVLLGVIDLVWRKRRKKSVRNTHGGIR